MKTKFNGYAAKIKSISDMRDGEHFIQYSPHFGALNEVVVSRTRPHEYPNALYVHYAQRDQERLMIVRQHELEAENVILFTLKY